MGVGVRVGRQGGEGRSSGCRSECGLWYRADLLPNASQTRPLVCWSLQRSNFTSTSCKGNVLCFLYSKWKMLNRNFQKHFCLGKGKGRSWKLENIHEISLKSQPILIISWEAVYQQSTTMVYSGPSGASSDSALLIKCGCNCEYFWILTFIIATVGRMALCY